MRRAATPAAGYFRPAPAPGEWEHATEVSAAQRDPRPQRGKEIREGSRRRHWRGSSGKASAELRRVLFWRGSRLINAWRGEHHVSRWSEARRLARPDLSINLDCPASSTPLLQVHRSPPVAPAAKCCARIFRPPSKYPRTLRVRSS
jgi:hypothetical protein